MASLSHAIKRDSGFMFRLHFLSNVQVFLVTILPVYNLINLYYTYSLEFVTSALADGFSLEFEWQQVSSSLQYSGRFQ